MIEANIEIGYSHQEVEAVKSPPDIAKLLHVSEEEPMLLVHSMTYSPSAKPILFDTSFIVQINIPLKIHWYVKNKGWQNGPNQHSH